MIERGQIFVRALNYEGKWDSVDVLDLDEESFRRWLLGIVGEGKRIAGVGLDTNVEPTPLKQKIPEGLL